MLFGLAIVVAIIRTTLRQRSPNYQRVPLDDVFLCSACIFLCVGTSLFYALIPPLYEYEAESGINGFSQTSTSPDALHKFLWLQKMIMTYQVMTWTAIFCVKASFLCFFRRLVDRLKPMLILWKTVVGITILSYIIIFGDLFVGCPYFSARAGKSTSIYSGKRHYIDMHYSSTMREGFWCYARLGY